MEQALPHQFAIAEPDRTKLTVRSPNEPLSIEVSPRVDSRTQHNAVWSAEFIPLPQASDLAGGMNSALLLESALDQLKLPQKVIHRLRQATT